MNEQVKKLMKNLGITEAEALEVIKADKAIDRGEKMDFDLTAEQAENARKIAHKGQGHTVYNFSKRERKENTEKAGIIAGIYEFLMNYGVDNAEITNKERQIAFAVGENKYELTLVQKRKPKS